MKPFIFLAFLMALLVLCVLEAHADDWERTGQVQGTSIIYGVDSDGVYYFANSTSDGWTGYMKPQGSGFIGRTTMHPGSQDMTFYRPDLNMMIDLETGVTCWNVGRPDARCK